MYFNWCFLSRIQRYQRFFKIGLLPENAFAKIMPWYFLSRKTTQTNVLHETQAATESTCFQVSLYDESDGVGTTQLIR